MINLPIPYDEELIYSTVARYKIRAGLISPKQLLDDIFEDRGVVATVDLPCHLSKITNHYPHNRFNLNYIAYQYTLFPLYAPFIPESRQQECLQWMASHSQGAIHLAIGSWGDIQLKNPLMFHACYNKLCLGFATYVTNTTHHRL